MQGFNFTKITYWKNQVPSQRNARTVFTENPTTIASFSGILNVKI